MNKRATREAYGEALVDIGKVNQNIIVLDADLSKSTKTIRFKGEFPERHINVGISEQDLMGTAAGFAVTGKIPFASTFAVFATGRAFDQIRNTIAYPGLNVKICATHAGITVGEDGGSHQSIEDISLMRSIPGMVVLSPADAIETDKMVKEISNYEGPVYLRLGRLAVPQIFDEKYEFQIGKSTIMANGNDVVILATGILVYESMEAAKILNKKGISTMVVNVSTIKPIDKEGILSYVKDKKLVVTAEEHSIIGGLGSAIAELLSEEFPRKMLRIGINDRFGESGGANELLEKFELKAHNIVERIEKNIVKQTIR